MVTVSGYFMPVPVLSTITVSSPQPSCGSQCVDRGEAGCSFRAHEDTFAARQLLLCGQQFLVGHRNARTTGLSYGV
jgi:hypothetical protein